MNTILSAISAIANINGQPVGMHPFITRFMNTVFHEKPSFSRCQTTWDPQLVLDYILSLGQNENLHISQMLMLLISGQRGQTLHLLDIRNMILTDSSVSFSIRDLLKTSGPGNHFSQLIFEAHTSDKRLLLLPLLDTITYKGQHH